VAIGVRQPSARQLEKLRISLAGQAVTYREVGATGRAPRPAGYRHDRRTIGLGQGTGAWTRARQALIEWKAHEGAGVAATPDTAPLRAGTVLTATTRIGPFWIIAPCRIVYVTDTPDRFGFAYGTLPGHPEEGDEAFHVLRNDEGTVRFEIVAFSKPAELLARLGGPVSRVIQQQTTPRYLDGVKRFVAISDPE
jgi:uncharacterized protein (UPF0548 family)